jgi:hypothetical protein
VKAGAGSERSQFEKNIGASTFQIHNCFPNGGLVKPYFNAMSSNKYCATQLFALVEPFLQI